MAKRSEYLLFIRNPQRGFWGETLFWLMQKKQKNIFMDFQLIKWSRGFCPWKFISTLPSFCQIDNYKLK